MAEEKKNYGVTMFAVGGGTVTRRGALKVYEIVFVALAPEKEGLKASGCKGIYDTDFALYIAIYSLEEILGHLMQKTKESKCADGK